MSDNMEYMGGIAKAVSETEELQDIDWVEVTLICEIDDDGYMVSTYGYAYDAQDNYTAIAPDIDDLEDPVVAYREWLRQEGDKGFIKMLFQFNRQTLKVNADFEYEDSSRWKVTPSNVDRIIEELRPKLGG